MEFPPETNAMFATYFSKYRDMDFLGTTEDMLAFFKREHNWETENEEILQHLGAELETHNEENCLARIHMAIREGSIHEFDAELSRSGLHIDSGIEPVMLQVGVEVNNILSLAVAYGKIDLMRHIMKNHRANMDLLDADLRTPFEIAVIADKVEVVHFFLHELPKNINEPFGTLCSPLMTACISSSINVCKYLLASGANVNQVCLHGRSALFYAARGFYLDFTSFVEIYDELHARGCDYSVTDVGGGTIIHYVLRIRHLPIGALSLLVERYLAAGLSLEATVDTWETTLWTAVLQFRPNVLVVQLLVHLGADVTARRSSDGMTVRSYVREMLRSDAIERCIDGRVLPESQMVRRNDGRQGANNGQNVVEDAVTTSNATSTSSEAAHSSKSYLKRSNNTNGTAPDVKKGKSRGSGASATTTSNDLQDNAITSTASEEVDSVDGTDFYSEFFVEDGEVAGPSSGVVVHDPRIFFGSHRYTGFEEDESNDDGPITHSSYLSIGVRNVTLTHGSSPAHSSGNGHDDTPTPSTAESSDDVTAWLSTTARDAESEGNGIGIPFYAGNGESDPRTDESSPTLPFPASGRDDDGAVAGPSSAAILCKRAVASVTVTGPPITIYPIRIAPFPPPTFIQVDTYNAILSSSSTAQYPELDNEALPALIGIHEAQSGEEDATSDVEGYITFRNYNPFLVGDGIAERYAQDTSWTTTSSDEDDVVENSLASPSAQQKERDDGGCC